MTTVGVVGPDGRDAVERALAAVDDVGATARTGDAKAVLDADLEVVVAIGEPAFLAVARADPTAPILPVAAGRGVRSVPESAVESAVASALSNRTTVERRLLSVAVAGEAVGPAGGESVGPAAFDVTLTTTEPGRISEYSVAAGATTVASFRADGVVVATPAGSQGYARRADGSVVAPELDAVAVVPVAPFAIGHDHWVLDLADPVRLAVEREEVPVSLLVDDREIREVGCDDRVEITPGGSLAIAVVPESQPFFGE